LLIITLKARTSVTDQCKDDDIGRCMGLCTVTSRLSFQPTPSNLTRTHRFKFHWSNNRSQRP